jgi:hypothetical protein
MKRTFAAAVAALTVAFATPALAADFILTDDQLIDGSVPAFSNFFVTSASSTTVSANLFHAPGEGAFLDRYIFAPTFLGVGSGSAVTNFNAALAFGIPGLQIQGYELTAGIAAALTTAFSTSSLADYNNAVSDVAAYLAGAPAVVYSQLGVPSGLDRQLFSVPLDPANFYVITIDGTSTSSDAIYSGNLTATSVPEPGTWAMMLAGFGLIGFAMRRKSQSHPKVRFAF